MDMDGGLRQGSGGAHLARVDTHPREVSGTVGQGEAHLCRVESHPREVTYHLRGVDGHARRVRGPFGQWGAHVARMAAHLREVTYDVQSAHLFIFAPLQWFLNTTYILVSPPFITPNTATG